MSRGPSLPTRARAARALAALLALAAAGPERAAAVQYEAEIRIENEMDLYELQLNGEIGDTTFATLLELLRVGIDLNTATRDEIYALPGLNYAQVDRLLEYRKAVSGIADPGQLVVSGILTREQLLQLQPFLVVGRVQAPDAVPGEGKPQKTGGSLRLMSSYTLGDLLVPPAFVQGRAQAFGHLTAGAALLLVRRMPGPLRYVPDAELPLQMGAPTPTPVLPKVFAQWDTPEFRVVAGTFRLGFGQRLTLDNTGRLTPDGVYLDDAVVVPQDLSRLCLESKLGNDAESPCANRYAYGTGDFRWSDGFRGVAATLKGLSVGAGRLRATIFGSYQARSAYQYELFDASRCANPRATTSDCSAPFIGYVPADGSPIGSKYAYATLPWGSWNEAVAGANASFTFDRARVGITGYGASPEWNVPGARLDFQEWSGTPFGGPYGALGIDGAWGTGALDFFFEAARSFDSMAGGTDGSPGPGGGFGVLQRTTAALDQGQELELSFRYYDRNFANGYGSPIAAADEAEGQRARNEAGVRARWSGKPLEKLALRAFVDFWVLPESTLVDGTAGRTNLDAFVRADWRPFKALEVSGWVEATDKDLSRFGPGDFDGVRNCFDQTLELDLNDRRIPCSGERFRVAGRVAYDFSDRVAASFEYQHDLQVDRKFVDAYRTDALAYLDTTVRPTDALRMRARFRYLNDAMQDVGYRENSLWSYLDTTYQLSPAVFARARYDFYWRFDQRASTEARTPQPENRFRLELETKF
jgi:hypothetical protein